MGKSAETLSLEDNIWNATKKQGVFGCFEVTIGWFGHERVDYLTYDTEGIWRCYELKASKADFHSKAAKTFVGHYNYFVMPSELYEEVKNEIPEGVGVYCSGLDYKKKQAISVKKAKKQALAVDEKILFGSMLRSLAREYQATRKSRDRKYLRYLIQTAEREADLRKYEQKVNSITNLAIFAECDEATQARIRARLAKDAPPPRWM